MWGRYLIRSARKNGYKGLKMHTEHLKRTVGKTQDIRCKIDLGDFVYFHPCKYGFFHKLFESIKFGVWVQSSNNEEFFKYHKMKSE